MNFRVKEEQWVLRCEAKNLARRAFLNSAARWDRDAEVPWENINLPGRTGYRGVHIRSSYEGRRR